MFTNMWGQCRSPPSFFISGSFINIKLDNEKSSQMVAQILPDKCFVFIFYDKLRKNERSLLHAVLYGQRVYKVYWGGYHGKT